MQDVSTAHTWLMISSNGASISFYYEMVSFGTHRMCTPPNNTALIAVDGSGSGDVLLDNIEINDGGLRIGAVDEVADAEEDLPGEEVRE